MKYLCLLIVMMTTVVLMAADPVGRVTSSGPLTLNGKAVPATAVSSLPVVAGDEIATSGSPAMIYFTDRSRATLEPNSRIKLEATQFFGGAARFVRLGRLEAGGRLATQLDPAGSSGGAELRRGPSFGSVRRPARQRQKPSPPPAPPKPALPATTTTATAASAAKSSLPVASISHCELQVSRSHDNPFEKIRRPESVLV